MTKNKETIQLRLDNRTAWITLDWPPLNILDIPMMEALDAALGRALPQSDFVIFQGKLLEDLRALSPAVLNLTRKTLWHLHAHDFAKQLKEVERVYLSGLMKTHDAQEGIRAFLEKRAPVWHR